MKELVIRCSALGKIMTNPTAAAVKAGEVLSAGAKTFIRSMAAEEILGVDFGFSSKYTEKGTLVEQDGIDLLNRVRGLNLAKNTERRTNGLISGECDLYDAERNRGHDIKCPWSAQTFPIAEIDCVDSDYEWQMRGYMALWNADEWEVNYCLVDTPDRLIGYEPLQLHVVSHIPENMRLTTWTVKRDPEKEAAMFQKVMHAREYYAQVIAEFDRTHVLELEPA